MAQAFITTYEKSYTWHNYNDKRKSLKSQETVYAEPPKADIWISDVVDESKRLKHESIDDLRGFVNKLYRNRNWSTYQVSYCKNQILERNNANANYNDTKEISENELIEYGKELFSERKQKIQKPLATSRKLFGYIRPSSMYSGLTEYQGNISKRGYDILLKNYLVEKEMNKQ